MERGQNVHDIPEGSIYRIIVHNLHRVFFIFFFKAPSSEFKKKTTPEFRFDRRQKSRFWTRINPHFISGSFFVWGNTS